MFDTSQLFRDYMAKYERQFECRVSVDGTVYGISEIISLEVEDSIASNEELELGAVIASKLTISIRTLNTISDNSQVLPEIRMLGDSGSTEWIPLGVFYIYSSSYQGGVWSITAFDRLNLTDQKFISGLTYPESMVNVLNEICVKLDLTLDASVTVDPTYQIPYKNEDISIRDMLSYIASAHGACVKLTKRGELAFLGFKASSTPTAKITPSDYTRLTQTNPIKTYTKLKAVYNTDGEFLEVGVGDSNHTLCFYNEFITEDILINIFNTLSGFSYVPISLQWRGNIYTEVGDTVSIGKGSLVTWDTCSYTWSGAEIPWDGVEFFTSVVLRSKLVFKGGLSTEISSPAPSEQKSSLEYEGSLSKQVKSALKQDLDYYGVVIGRQSGLKIKHSSGRSEVTLNSDKIAFEVDGEDVLYFDAVNKKYKYKGEVVIDSATDLGKRISFIDGNGVFSGSIDVDDDVYIGDDLIFGNGKLAIRSYASGYYLERGGVASLKFWSDALYVYGSIAISSGRTLGVISGENTLSGRIYMYSDRLELLSPSSNMPVNIYGYLAHKGSRLGFYNTSPISQPNIAWTKPVVVTQTAGSTYTSNEQSMLNNLKKDVQNLQRTLSELWGAVVNLGLARYYTW